jgi:hypothetical protein
MQCETLTNGLPSEPTSDQTISVLGIGQGVETPRTQFTRPSLDKRLLGLANFRSAICARGDVDMAQQISESVGAPTRR